MKKVSVFCVLLVAFMSTLLNCCSTQQNPNDTNLFLDRLEEIRKDYSIPGLGLCIFSSDSIFEYTVLGVKRLGYENEILNESIWHLGSNTKSFIAYAAAAMVEQGTINWGTEFFDIFPEYKEFSKAEYSHITLLQLLQHRAGLPPNTRSFPELILNNIEVDTVLERRTLFEWALTKDRFNEGYQYSNIGYVMATSMLEKASGKSWKELLEQLIFVPLSMKSYYGWPAKNDTAEIWGHLVNPETNKFEPHSPNDLYYLEKFSIDPAGDLSLSIPDFVKFLQDNLKGYNGREAQLNTVSYQLMHNGNEYGMGWGIVEAINESFKNVSVHSGSAGTFYSKALLFKNEDFGIVICMNRYLENNNEIIYPLVNEILDEYCR